MKMKQFNIVTVVSVLLLLPAHNSLARRGKDVYSKKPDVGQSAVISIKNAVVSKEDHILKGVTAPIDDRKIGDAIFGILSKNPDHVYQIDAHSEKSTTFREMKDRSIRLAIWMKKLGISPNNIIVECSHNHLDTYIPLLSTFFIDAIFSSWETNIPLHKARFFMKEYTPKLIFTNEETADVLLKAAKLENTVVKFIVFGKHSSLQSLSEIMNSQTKEDINNFTIVNTKKSNEVSVILLSSGTTATPKGIMLSSRSVYLLTKGVQSIDPCDAVRVLWTSMLHWFSGFQPALNTILEKKTRIISQISDENQLFQIVEKYKVNNVDLPFFLIHSIAKSNFTQKYNLESLKSVRLSGAKFNRNIFLGLRKKLPGVLVLYLYGITETGGISASSPKSEYLESVGFVLPNVQVKFVDPVLGNALGPNELGEIYVKSPTMMIGYYKNPVKTQEVLDTNGWYHTGDLGYYHENGEIFITDRISEIIEYKNHQISPGRIEAFLSSNPEVKESAVVPIPDPFDGELPIVFIKKVRGSNVTKEDISGILSIFENLKQLRVRIYFLDQMPRTSTGKIARQKLKQLAIDFSMKKDT